MSFYSRTFCSFFFLLILSEREGDCTSTTKIEKYPGSGEFSLFLRTVESVDFVKSIEAGKVL